MKKNDSLRKKMLKSSFLLGLFLVLFGFSAKAAPGDTVFFEILKGDPPVKLGATSVNGLMSQLKLDTATSRLNETDPNKKWSYTGNTFVPTGSATDPLNHVVNLNDNTATLTTPQMDMSGATTFSVYFSTYKLATTKGRVEILVDGVSQGIVNVLDIFEKQLLGTYVNGTSSTAPSFMDVCVPITGSFTATSKITFKSLDGFIGIKAVAVLKGKKSGPDLSSLTVNGTNIYKGEGDYTRYYGQYVSGNTANLSVTPLSSETKVVVTNVETGVEVGQSVGNTLNLTNLPVPGRYKIEMQGFSFSIQNAAGTAKQSTYSYEVGLMNKSSLTGDGSHDNPYNINEVKTFHKYGFYGNDITEGGDKNIWVKGYIIAWANNCNTSNNGTAGIVLSDKDTLEQAIPRGTTYNKSGDTVLIPAAIYNTAGPEFKVAYDTLSSTAANYRTKIFEKVLVKGFLYPAFKAATCETGTLDSIVDYEIYSNPEIRDIKFAGRSTPLFRSASLFISNRNISVFSFGYDTLIQKLTAKLELMPRSSKAKMTYKVGKAGLVQTYPVGGIPAPASLGDTIFVTVAGDSTSVITGKTIRTREYQVTFTPISSDASLSALSVSGHTTDAYSREVKNGDFQLKPAFHKDTLNYTLKLAHRQAKAGALAFALTKSNSAANVISPVNAGVLTQDSTFSFVVMAEDSLTTKTYTVAVTVLPVSNVVKIDSLFGAAGNPSSLVNAGSGNDTATYSPANWKSLTGNDIPKKIDIYLPFNRYPRQDQATNLNSNAPFSLKPNCGKWFIWDASRQTPTGGTNLIHHSSTGTDVTTQARSLHANDSLVFGQFLYSEDSTMTDTIYYVIHRLPNTDPGMDSIYIKIDGSMYPAEKLTAKSYERSVPNSMNHVDSIMGIPVSYGTFKTTPTDSIRWSGNGRVERSVSPNTPLAVGPNEFKVYTVAEDGITRDSITVTITREESANNITSNITVTTATLEPLPLQDTLTMEDMLFDENVYAYFVKAKTSDFPITILTVPEDASATPGIAEVNAADVPEGQYEDKETGWRFVTVSTTAENGAVGQSYTVYVGHMSENNKLSDLKVNGTTIAGFDADDTDYVYTTIGATVPTVAATGENYTTIAYTQATKFGDTAKVTVTSQAGVNRIYKVVMLSTDTTLSALSVTGQTLAPAFDPTRSAYTVSNIARNITSVTVNATPTSPGLPVGGTGNITLTGDTTEHTVTVTADGGIGHYTITFIKTPAASVATLSALGVTGYTLTPTFESDTFEYTVSDVTGDFVVVTATATDANATIAGTGNIDLTGDTTTHEVVVTAEDGTTTETYTVTLIKKVTGVEDVKDLENISLYPNPVADVVSVNLEKAQGKVTFSFYNAAGALISTKVVNGGSVQTIDVSKLATGTYSVVIATEKGSVTKKIVKQ